jgi:RNA polymerase sigma-70 factor (TIGR02952 family)
MPPPRPVDAGRQAADAAPRPRPSPHPRHAPQAVPSPRPRPTPFPRSSGEEQPPALRSDNTAVESITGVEPEAAVDPEEAVAQELTEELAELQESGVVPEAPRVDVWALVHRAQAGDADAFGQLYDHYVTMVHRYAYHRVGDRATAEDVTSETFVRALRRIDSLSFQGRDVGAWLVTIARNLIRDLVKSSRYRLEVVTAEMRDADSVTDGPEDAVVTHLANQELLACVRQLGSEQQECIVLRFIHGLSVSETAQIMGKKDGAIKALQHRAVRRLAGMLPEGLR